MKSLTLASVLLGVFFTIFFTLAPTVSAHNGEEHTLETSATLTEEHFFVFGRNDCSYCEEQLAFLDEENLPYIYLNIDTDPEALRLYNLVLEKHTLSRVTPLTIVGEKLFLGFNGSRTTGQQIKKQLLVESPIQTLEQHLEIAPVQPPEEGLVCTGVTCEMGNEGSYIVTVPYFGVLDLKTFLLSSVPLILLLLGGVTGVTIALWRCGRMMLTTSKRHASFIIFFYILLITLLLFGLLLCVNLVLVLQ